ncbi:hypothetical protein [Sphingobium lignivorans]|uniref:Uncharacterized protein n=1 Tax=Sphingobium lignivorans TaxID=2735886 RepID=A0ABR6NFE0_9SPHN|nr:hypothetical protein [Sphingobium lignivorans]MBB5985994.1 hypothetical protein [Sphingobium lignivorans]
MNKPFSDETRHAINGIDGRLYARHVRPDAPHLFSAQKWISEGRRGREARIYGPNARLHAVIRFDDSCKNGHQSFAITAEISGAARRIDDGSIGCHHEAIAETFPELAHLIKWHLCSTDGPMHYISNTIYHAGDRDHNGLRAGERRQIINGRTKQPCWTLEAVNAEGVRISSTPTGDMYRGAETVPLFILEKGFDGQQEDLPPAPVLKWVPLYREGEGKARDLDAARQSAAWPDATDEELSAEPDELKAALEARLPALIEAFRADMSAAGLLWSPLA